MIIHLIGSRKATQTKSHIRIVNSIKENDAILILDDYVSNLPWEQQLTSHLDAISRADAVIIEASGRDFYHGFFAACAIERKKPVLIVTQENSETHPLAAIAGRNCQVEQYKTEATLARVVKKFIQDNTIYTKDLRFNLFIDRPIYNYLRTISDQTGKNKSEIIRDLINREITKND